MTSTVLHPYPAYKDSGIEWLGRIPAHWSTKRIKHLLIGRKGAIKTGPFGSQLHSSEMMDNEIKVFNQRTVLDRDIDGGRNYISAAKFDELKAFETFPGDLLVTTRGTIGRCMIVPTGAPRGVLHPCLLRIQIEKRIAYRHYIEYLIEKSGLILSQLEFMSNATTIDVIYSDSLKEAFLPLPPLPEQRAIAAFLDRETARIDALVAKKERLIELLQEKRAALISHAVTRGLDPNAAMKDSGVEWLGEIPAHWEVKRLITVIKFQRGHDLPSDNREEGEVPVVTSSGISSMHSRAVASAPGIVTGRCGTIGQFYLINRSYWPHNTALYSIDLHRNEPRFLQYMLVHLAPLFYLHSIKSAVPAVDRNDVHAEHTAIPPVSEQRAIADILDRKTSNLDALVTKIEGAIDCLKELRAALISSVVTGKIDVCSLV